MRTLLVTGPGGAGTSTTAAAMAVRAASTGRRIVLLGARPAAISGLDAVPGLTVVAIDGLAAGQRLWAGSSGTLAGLLPQLDLPPATSVPALPGATELALFAAAAEADADLVVLDAGPLDAASTLLGLPATLGWWRDQLLPPGVRALAAVRSAAVTAGVRRGPVDAALASLPVVEELLARDRLTEPGATALCFVADARTAAAAQLRTASTAVGLHGVRAASVLSRVLPVGPGPWWAARAAEQRAALEQLAAIGALHEVPEQTSGPTDLAGLEEVLGDWELPEAGAAAVPSVGKRGGARELAVPLPFAEHGGVELTRWADDLVITVAGARRNVRLDSVLRRCEVTGARLTDQATAAAALVVGFAPDPRLWPADLLAAEGGAG